MTALACSGGSESPTRDRVRVCMRACTLAGPGFVCFPPNWLVFPCPAHQTACFSSHLASPPGLEPPARMRPARRLREEEGQAAHAPGQARSGQAGWGDPSSSSPPRPHPHSSSSCLGIQGPWPVLTLSRDISSGLPNAHLPPIFSLPNFFNHGLLFPSQRTEPRRKQC